jgi:hypothetical protein
MERLLNLTFNKNIDETRDNISKALYQEHPVKVRDLFRYYDEKIKSGATGRRMLVTLVQCNRSLAYYFPEFHRDHAKCMAKGAQRIVEAVEEQENNLRIILTHPLSDHVHQRAKDLTELLSIDPDTTIMWKCKDFSDSVCGEGFPGMSHGAWERFTKA